MNPPTPPPSLSPGPAPGGRIARVAVDLPLSHLDRLFDYEIPADLDAAAVPGVRVRVRFAGQQVPGWLLERTDVTEHPGRLTRLTRVVDTIPVLTPEIAALARIAADRYAGTLTDVLRAAVPPRHARVERAVLEELPAQPADQPAARADPGNLVGDIAGGWDIYRGGAALLRRIAAARKADAPGPRAVWTASPGGDAARDIAALVAAARSGGHGVLVIVPDHADVARLDQVLRRGPEPDGHVVLTAGLGPTARYRAFLRARLGLARVVVGTRAAVFAPVADLGLIVLWDDGDDLYSEPRAPYWHAREVLVQRAHAGGGALVIGALSRSAEAALLVTSGWARSIEAPRAQVRAGAPRVVALDDDRQLARDPAARSARLPHIAFEATRDGLAEGPVLVQVSRAGYLPSLACAACRAPATCVHCSGPLSSPGRGAPGCGWCGRVETDWHCPHCQGSRLRAGAVGSERTAEELGRAFPGVAVIRSSGDQVRTDVDASPALVVATAGAEPTAAGGYAAALLLDARSVLERPDLRAAEEAVRRWVHAAALVRPGGSVVLTADSVAAAVQALIRWDPVGFIEHELVERGELGLPPTVRMAALTGAPADLADFLHHLEPVTGVDVLGPVPVPAPRAGPPSTDPDGPQERALIRVPRAHGSALSAALKAAQSRRSARKDGGPVTVRVDPLRVG